jgi:hypothetical protein
MASPRHKSRLPAGAAPAICLGLLLAANAWADVKRCEDDNGRVTYSNQPCPAGTAKERAVEQRPAVEVPAPGTGAKATKDGVLKLPEAPTAKVTPSSQDNSDTGREQKKAQVARCDDLVHRIEYGQQDLTTATGAEHASVELSLRRLQDEYASNCAPH